MCSVKRHLRRDIIIPCGSVPSYGVICVTIMICIRHVYLLLSSLAARYYNPSIEGCRLTVVIFASFFDSFFFGSNSSELFFSCSFRASLAARYCKTRVL